MHGGGEGYPRGFSRDKSVRIGRNGKAFWRLQRWRPPSSIIMINPESPKEFKEAAMSNHVESLTWLTDLHLEFCSHRTRDRFYHSINQAPGEIVVITGDLSAGPHRLAQYTELAEQIRKPVYFVLGNHDRYGTTFANAEATGATATTLFPHIVRLHAS